MSAPGILSDTEIRALADQGGLRVDAPFDADQVQPASLDLRLGREAFRLRASFLPGPAKTVAERLEDPRLVMHRIDLSGGAVLETGCVYLAPLMESLALSPEIEGRANPKSSTGRVDVFTRVIADRAEAFDVAPVGYRGPLYLEISPRTFSILVRPGARLAQLRLRRDPPTKATRAITLSVDLSGRDGGLAGYRAKRHAGVIDLDRVGEHDPRDYWEPLYVRDRALVLDPGEFYILASAEEVVIPSHEAAEMAPIAPEIGEFRAHYAGFFDPGFGVEDAGGAGGRAVLEVRGRDVPFILEHGQAAARLVYEPMAADPARLYGATGSHYQAQGLKLSKHFRPWSAIPDRVSA